MINKDKTYRTRDGREVRIYATDGGNEFSSIHGAVKMDDVWEIETWANDGRWCSQFDDEDSPLDLIEVKPRIKRGYWVNVYTDHIGKLFESRAMANTNMESERIACVKVVIDCEEGEGL